MNDNAVSKNDYEVLRKTARRYMEIAQMDVMAERKKLWKALHDLKPQRPMFMFEPYWVDGFLSDDELECEDSELKNVEAKMKFAIKQFDLIGDDVVLEPYFRFGWFEPTMTATGRKFGDVEIVEHTAEEAGLAYLSNFPIKTPDDLKKLKHREFTIDKSVSIAFKEKLENIFGDVLPVRLGNFDNFSPGIGNQPFTGNNFLGVTWDFFKLVGAEQMMFWVYDYPDAVHELCSFLVEDKKNFYDFLLKEGILEFNSDNQFGGPSSYGYVSDLPECGSDKKVELADLWTWPESQETESISPDMYNEFFLPYIAELANMFGLSYYACCEGIHDRFEYTNKAIKNIRTVSVSGWSDLKKAGELLGNNYVYSRKPVPAYVSSPESQWDLVEKDAKDTFAATRHCCVEVILRDVYSALCPPERAAEWVRRWKQNFDVL